MYIGGGSLNFDFRNTFAKYSIGSGRFGVAPPVRAAAVASNFAWGSPKLVCRASRIRCSSRLDVAALHLKLFAISLPYQYRDLCSGSWCNSRYRLNQIWRPICANSNTSSWKSLLTQAPPINSVMFKPSVLAELFNEFNGN